MTLLTKLQLVESYVSKIKNIEDVKEITVTVEFDDGSIIKSRFLPTTNKKYPTKREKIIKECMSLMRNRRVDSNEPEIFTNKINVGNINKIWRIKLPFKSALFFSR